MDGLPPPAWTAEPKVTGAYWFKVEGADPDICWIHADKVFWSTPPYSMNGGAGYMGEQYGACFWGPIPWPSDPQPEGEESRSQERYCADCAHYRRAYTHDGNCRAEQNLRRDLVSGDMKPIQPPSWMRGANGACGPEGKLFKGI